MKNEFEKLNSLIGINTKTAFDFLVENKLM